MAKLLSWLAVLLGNKIVGYTLGSISIILLVVGLGHQAGGARVHGHSFVYATAAALPFAVLALASAITMINEQFALLISGGSAFIGLFTPASPTYPNLHTNYIWFVLAGTAIVFAGSVAPHGMSRWSRDDKPVLRFNRAIGYAIVAVPFGILFVNHTWKAIIWAVIAMAVLTGFYELLKYYGKAQADAGSHAGAPASA